MPFELLDVILVVLVLISGFLAMVRGFSREILSISSWIIAAILAFLFYSKLSPLVAGYTQEYTSNEKVPDIIAAAIIFVLALIVVSFITMKIADFIVDSRVGALDRTLGFIFGAVRGVLLVTVLLLLYVNLKPNDQFTWIANAKCKPMLESIGQGLVELIPDDPEKLMYEWFKIGDPPDSVEQETSSG